ncbi:MAG: tetratricopeptide repeat protein [Bacteroidota bacterium]
MVRTFVTTYLAMPEVRAEIERAGWQSTRDLQRLVRQHIAMSEQAGENVQDLLEVFGKWIETEVLYDPRRSIDAVAEAGTLPKPSTLLNAAYEVVPFSGREKELRKIRAFRESDAPFSVLLLEGAGGLGKTRLMMEAMRHALADKWRAGFLRSDLDAATTRQQLEALSRTDQDLFVVVDYAEDRPDQVAALIAEWIESAPKKRRLVLLTRHRALVEQTLQREGIRHQRRQSAYDYLTNRRAIEMQPKRLEVALEHRRGVFEAAQAAFATRAGLNPATLFSASDLSDDFFDLDHFARPLYLHMAALASLSGPPTARKEGLLAAALEREDAYLQRVLDDIPALKHHKLEGKELRPVLALATLAMATRPQGATGPTALALVEASALGDDLNRREREALALLLTDLYPRPDLSGSMDALRPDALGEGLVHSTLKAVPTLATYALAAERDTASLASAATVLVRAAQALEDDAPEAWLRTHLPPLQKRPRLVQAFNDSIHKDTSRLRTLAASIAAWLVSHARHALKDNSDEVIAQKSLAHALIWQGLRLSKQGRHKDALAATKEAVALFKRLALRNPDAFEPDLASSLNNLGGVLSDLGRYEKALTATEEAVSIVRRLAQSNPDTREPDLATSLNNLSVTRSRVGRYAEAIVATEEAVSIQRRLAQRNPDTYEPNLASSLNNLGMMRSILDSHEDALSATEEAVKLYQHLAKRNPDTYEPDLATSLNNLSVTRSKLDIRDEAIAAAKEAISIRQRLAQRNPDAFEPDLANAFWALGAVYNAFGEYEAALTPLPESLRLLLPHFERLPPAHARQMQGTLQSYDQACQGAEQEPEEALLAPLIAILQQLEEQAPPSDEAPND